MLQSHQVEQLICLVSSLDRSALKRQFQNYPSAFPIDFTEEFLYGHLRKQQLVKHWEGETIAVDITRKVPKGERLFEWYGK